MGRELRAYFYTDSRAYEAFLSNDLVSYDDIPRCTCLEDKLSVHHFDMGEFNLYEGTVDELREHICKLSRTATRGDDWLRVSYLAIIVADSIEYRLPFIVIRND